MVYGFILLTTALCALVFLKATPYMLAASISYSILAAGLVWRKRRSVHITLMNLGIALDLILVLILQIQRNAVHTALEFSLSPLQQAHVAAGTMATILYFPTLYLGWTGRNRRWHMRIGILAFVFRTLGFLLMFSLLERASL